MSIRKALIALATVIALMIPAAPAFAHTIGGNPGPDPSTADTCTPTPYDTPSGVPSDTPSGFAFGYNPCPPPVPKCPLIVRGVPQPLSADPATRAAELRACPDIRQEDFGLTDTNIIRNGFVTATGPVHFRFARDFTLSPTLDLFRQFGVGSVLVHSQPLGGVVIDFQDCSITLDQNDLPWFILARTGTGLFFNAQGAGVYDLRGIFSYPTRGFYCSLSPNLTVAQATWSLNHGGIGLPAPLDWGITVNATGWASVAPNLSRYDYGLAG